VIVEITDSQYEDNSSDRLPTGSGLSGKPSLPGRLCMNHLRFLHYVEEVARVGSIRQAAERLHVAASAVNRRVQDIENELGTAIFERLPRGVRLTAAGELFVGYIRSRSADLARVRSEIEELQGLRRGLVKVIASQALASVFLPSAIASFRKKHPLVAFEVIIGDHLRAAEALRSFETDIALVFNMEVESDIDRIAEFEQSLHVLMHRSHPLEKRQGVLRLRDCVDYPLVMPHRDIGARQMIESFLAEKSLKLRPCIESNNFEFLRGYLYQEQALSFQIAIGAVTDGGQLVSKEIGDRGFPKGHLVLASLRGRQLPVIAHVFAEHLKKSHDAQGL
jgi:DNA-binding transcriptional LysR family regulator